MPGENRPSNPWRARIAWLLILALITLIVYRNSRSKPAANGDSDIEDLQIRVIGEQLIGIKSLAAIAGSVPTAQLKVSHQRAISQLEEAATTPNEFLHVAIIAGEVLGKDQALEKLAAIHPPTAELTRDILALRSIYADKASALDRDAQDRLIRNHGYFGRVALSYEVPSSQEPRKSIEADGVRATIVLGVVGLFFILFLLSGLGFFIAALVLRFNGRLRCSYLPDPSAGGIYLEAFALYFVLFILGFGLLRRFLNLASLQWEWLALLIIPAVTLWLRKNGASRHQIQAAFGWHRGKGILRELGAGVAGYLAGIVVIIAGFFVTYILMKHSGVKPEHPLIHMLEGNRWHVLGLYLLVSVFAPLMEETMFRGALFHHLRRRWGWAISAPVVAFIFAIIHPQGWVAVPVLGSIAIVLAALREWRGSLIAPMVAHGLNNFIVLTVALATLR